MSNVSRLRNHVVVRHLRAAPVAVLAAIVWAVEIGLKLVFAGVVLAIVFGIPVYVIDWILS